MSDGTDRGLDDVSTDGGAESLDLSEVTTGDVRPPQDSGTASVGKTRQEFLQEVVRRTPLLRSLRAGASATSDLLESVDVSRSTLHRATDSLKDHELVVSDDCEYELTGLGHIIADEAERFATRTWTAVTLKQFLNAINGDREGIPLEHLADATITRRAPRQPHVTIHRIINLIEEADSLRMFSTVISPVYVDVGYREMMDGMQIEAIFDREVVELMLTEYPEKAHDTITTGNFQVLAHDGVPFELFLVDDKIGMAAHNENGNAEVLVESENPEAIAWAEELYAEHRDSAVPLLTEDL